MVLPIIWVIGTIVTVVVADQYDKSLNEKRLRNRKKVLLLGPKGSGKTTLFQYLVNDKYTSEGMARATTTATSDKRLNEDNSVLVHVYDLPGTTSFSKGDSIRKDWEKGLQEVTREGRVLYVVSAKSLTGSTLTVVNSDVEWIKKRLGGQKLGIVITHLDETPLPKIAGFAQFNSVKADELWRGNLLDESEMSDLVGKLEQFVNAQDS
jgi:GTPase SAR1 family protein